MRQKLLQTVSGAWVIRWRFHCILTLFFALAAIVSIYLQITDNNTWLNSNEDQELIHDAKSSLSNCDLFTGKWVFDNNSYPLYKEQECTFMVGDMACETYGRKDLTYQYWRWQPNDCDLPRFNGKALLERLRGKRLVFVGDSLNRNQWVSMLCMVEKSFPQGLDHFKDFYGPLNIFKANEYNATIENYWSPMLIESNGDDPWNHHTSSDTMIRFDIAQHARKWTDADILIFDTYKWWLVAKLKVMEGSNETEGYKEMNSLECYEMALKTWSSWLELHVNHTRTKMFWITRSPTHDWSISWGTSENRKCLNETQPLLKYKFRSPMDAKVMSLTKAAISRLKTSGVEVQMLNITHLSEYRKDAHPSIYKKQWHPLSNEELAHPIEYADCLHWCLPGVPDVWNEILYAYIMYH